MKLMKQSIAFVLCLLCLFALMACEVTETLKTKYLELSVEQALASDEIKQMQENMKESMTMDILVEGHSIVYEYRLVTETADAGLFAQSMKNSINISDYDALVAELQGKGVDDVVVVVRVLNADGSLIFSISNPDGEEFLATAAPTAAPEDILQDLVAETLADTNFQAAQASYADIWEIDISAEDGRAFVYTYTYLETAPEMDKEVFVEGREAERETLALTYDALAQQLREGGVPDAVVIIRYIGSDGAELYSTTFGEE